MTFFKNLIKGKTDNASGNLLEDDDYRETEGKIVLAINKATYPDEKENDSMDILLGPNDIIEFQTSFSTTLRFDRMEDILRQYKLGEHSKYLQADDIVRVNELITMILKLIQDVCNREYEECKTQNFFQQTISNVDFIGSIFFDSDNTLFGYLPNFFFDFQRECRNFFNNLCNSPKKSAFNIKEIVQNISDMLSNHINRELILPENRTIIVNAAVKNMILKKSVKNALGIDPTDKLVKNFTKRLESSLKQQCDGVVNCLLGEGTLVEKINKVGEKTGVDVNKAMADFGQTITRDAILIKTMKSLVLDKHDINKVELLTALTKEYVDARLDEFLKSNFVENLTNGKWILNDFKIFYIKNNILIIDVNNVDIKLEFDFQTLKWLTLDKNFDEKKFNCEDNGTIKAINYFMKKNRFHNAEIKCI